MRVEPAEVLGTDPMVAIDPQGTRVAFVGISQGHSELFVRPIERLEATLLPGTVGASAPAFSPDGRSIAFFADDFLKKISADGGPVQSICPARDANGAVWVSNETIIFGSGNSLMRVSSRGGTAENVVKNNDNTLIAWPVAIQGSRNILFSSRSSKRY
jgi:serine/threonine-protein kinase